MVKKERVTGKGRKKKMNGYSLVFRSYQASWDEEEPKKKKDRGWGPAAGLRSEKEKEEKRLGLFFWQREDRPTRRQGERNGEEEDQA